MNMKLRRYSHAASMAGGWRGVISHVEDSVVNWSTALVQTEISTKRTDCYEIQSICPNEFGDSKNFSLSGAKKVLAFGSTAMKCVLLLTRKRYVANTLKRMQGNVVSCITFVCH